MSSAIARARTAWGDELPDWVAALAAEADRTSQRAAAARIGYSAAVVNQVLGRTYRGSWSRIERAVRLALLPERVDCPVLGAITTTRCAQHQRAPAYANHELAELARTCPVCPHREEKRP